LAIEKAYILHVAFLTVWDGLNGPEIESRLGRAFPHLSRPA